MKVKLDSEEEMINSRAYQYNSNHLGSDQNCLQRSGLDVILPQRIIATTYQQKVWLWKRQSRWRIQALVGSGSPIMVALNTVATNRGNQAARYVDPPNHVIAPVRYVNNVRRLWPEYDTTFSV